MNESFAALRLRIEAGRELPLTISIASATEIDATDHVALGLGRAFAETGARVLTVFEGKRSERATRDAEQADSLARIVSNLRAHPEETHVAACLRPNANNETQSEARNAMAALRARYDVVVMEAPNAAARSGALLRATIADVVIVAVRVGRSGVPADRILVDRLQTLGVHILGVVGTSGRPDVAEDVPARTLATDVLPALPRNAELASQSS